MFTTLFCFRSEEADFPKIEVFAESDCLSSSVSSSAIRFDGEQNMGVFILDRGEVKFRKIEVVYEGNGYVIAKWYKGENGKLQLFDEVFTAGSDLYAGKVID